MISDEECRCLQGLVLYLLAILTSASAASLSRCPDGCATFGTCNEELGRCDCPRHLQSPSCDVPVSDLPRHCKRYGYTDTVSCTSQVSAHLCLNNCTSRGNCIAGWCHCQAGYFGADCSLSLDAQGQPEQLAGLGYVPAPAGPAIYIYELPPTFNTWRNIDKYDRPLHSQIWKRIISSGHRTLDGSKADYYYIPTDFRYLRSDTSTILEYIWQTWPYWNQTGGARHLLLSTSDLGACEGADLMRIRDVTQNVTWLTAWGLTQKHAKVWWPGCHRPGQDIVIPIPAFSPGMAGNPLNVAVQPKPQRNITFYFAGKICGDNKAPKDPKEGWPICQSPVNPLYSAGMRQWVYYHHANRTGWKIVTHTPSYNQDMSTSLFCLAPTGGGHGKRQVLVGRFGCIPVPITDHVLQPYEPELPWSEFSVTVPEADVPVLHHILANITADKLKKMQAALECASRHLWWSTMWGSIFGEDGRYDAFATLMEILAARRRHPGVKPEELIQVDEHFAKFARCELGDDTAAMRKHIQSGSGQPHDPGGGTKQHRRNMSDRNTGSGKELLCFYGHTKELLPYAPSGLCSLSKWGKYGYPGGVVCQGAPNIAQCRRPWQ